MTPQTHPETKQCPLCAEAIKSSAKVCPHCRHWQTFWSARNPTVLGVFITAFYSILFVALGISAEHLFGPKEDFAQHRGDIIVLESRMSARTNAETNCYLTVVGTVTNQGEFSWEDINLEARFYDSASNLIDAISTRGDYSGIALLARSEGTFKIQTLAARPVTAYARHEVSVSWGKDAKSWP